MRKQSVGVMVVAVLVGALLSICAVPAAGASAKPRAFAFFNQYCVACKREAGALGHWAEAVAGRYRVTGVGFREDPAEAKAFASSLGLDAAVVGDPDGRLARRLGVGNPTTIVVIDHGKVKSRLNYAHWPLPSADARKVIPHPLYTASFAWQSYQPEGGFLLVRYLELSSARKKADLAFAQESQKESEPSVRAVSVTCGSGSAAWRRLRAAGISAPVLVDEAADCPQDLNQAMAGIADPSGGPERLYAPDGRLVSSDLNINSTVNFAVQPWMEFPPILTGGYAAEDSGALNVPVPPNVVRSELSFTGAPGDLAVRGFWWLCPTCVGSEADYELEGWRAGHPGAQLVAATCDPNIHEAADFVVEHQWTFPVYVYDGPLSFATCFSQVMGGQLGFQWYGDQAYLRGGGVSSAAKASFPGLPEY
jgi:thiol-disulfide isomerase/thioredoxin